MRILKAKKSIRICNILSCIVLVVLALAEGQLLWKIRKLNMLPNSYFLALVGILLLITALLCLLLFRKRRGRWQKQPGFGKQILGYVLSAAVILGCFAAGNVVGRVQGTIDAITAPEKINVILEVYVRAEDEARYIQDTARYTFAISEDVPTEDAEKLLAELETLVGNPVETASYPNTIAALDALLSGEADAAVLNSAYLDVLEDVEGYENARDKLKILHELVIEKEVPLQTKPADEEQKQNAASHVTDGPFLIYISGNDARRALLADGCSDVNILLLVNPKTHQILLINTPRDYYVVNPASGNTSRDKLSHCGLRGIDNCVQAVSGLYGQEIDYYARINFSGFRTLVDAIGGVTVYSDIAFPAGDYYIQVGENYLNGEQALRFARERKNLAGGDNDRGKNQMKLISAMVRQLSVGNLISNYAEILESLEGMFSTNFPAEEIGRLVQLQLTEKPQWEVLTFAVTGDNGNDFCWAVGGYGYVMYPHQHMVDHASALMERFLNGEVLTKDDLIPEA